MRRLANTYLFLFLVDAGMSLFDELLVTFGQAVPAITSLRLVTAYAVVGLSPVLYACLGIDRRLPKRLIVPLTVYIAWCTVALWPMSAVMARENLPLLAALGQVLLVAILLVAKRGRLWLAVERFQGKAFRLGNTLGFTAVNLLLLPCVLLFGALAATSDYLEKETAGFLRLSPVGVYLSERSYRHDDQEIRLAGMMHVGQQAYYDDLARSLPVKGAVILAEGVSDQDRLLTYHFNYSELAAVMGLSSQETMQIDANRIDLDQLDAHTVGRANKPDIVRADIDVNRFAPETIEFLNLLGRTLFSASPLAERFAEYSAWADRNMTPNRMNSIMADILDKRNEVVIGSMIRTLGFYDTVVIPWGAMHMPAIERAVLAQGFVAGPRQERLALDFRTLPYAELWRKWSARAADPSS